jgi:uncharacterized protein (DUF2141 family)
MIKRIFTLIALLLLLYPAVQLTAQEVEVTITDIRSEKGQIVIGFFRDDATFQKEDALLSKKFPKKDIKNGEMKVQFSMEPGLFGLSLLDDENSSGLMEYNFLGIPKEGFGFSDYYHTGIKKPKFDAFKFTLTKGQNKKITIKIRYM